MDLTRALQHPITVKINTIPSVIHSWVMTHINQCEIIGSKSFRDKMKLWMRIENIVCSPDMYKNILD